ncbi:SDR family NAD(P)-dependent oxidoreductase [Chloroflexota bacterium]
MELGLKGKVAIVTGGGSNIGRGIVLAFAREGSNIVIAEIDEPQAEKVAGEARDLGAEGVLVVGADVTRLDQIEQMVSKTLDRFKAIDVLVNNVAMADWETFVEKPRETGAREVDLALWSVINCTHSVLSHMIDRKTGSIVNISSHCGRQGYAGLSYYSAAKAGVIGFTQAIAREAGEYGIRLNCIAPGRIPPTRSEEIGKYSKTRWSNEEEARKYLEESLKDLEQRACIKRLGTAEDIANAVVFLTSDAAGYITGQTLNVCGGLTFH